MDEEFGSFGNIRFSSPSNSCMYDGQGNVVTCKCGNPAGSAAIGKEAFLAWCSKCSPLDERGARFIYRPPTDGEMKAMDATIGVKFSQSRVILDDWWLFGGTPWTRFKFRLKHPIVYSKRGILGLYRRIKRIFVKPKMIQCLRREK